MIGGAAEVPYIMERLCDVHFLSLFSFLSICVDVQSLLSFSHERIDVLLFSIPTGPGQTKQDQVLVTL